MTRGGISFDAHRFDDDPARALVLGGVTIPDTPGLVGHSDADVLSHCIADALLGAAGLGDLGRRFPSDDRWRGASSLEILEHTANLLGEAGWRVGNIDSTIIAERPPLAPHQERMVAEIARALDVDADRVSVKITSTDGLGFAGRGEGIAALAAVTIEEA